MIAPTTNPPVACEFCAGSGIAAVTMTGWRKCGRCKGEGFGNVPEFAPCPFPPGSWQKLAYLQVRQARGERLWHPHDAPPDDWEHAANRDLLCYAALGCKPLEDE